MVEKNERNHLKPYDYKNGEPDNDGILVERIYAKSPDFVVYRTNTALRVDMDDSCPNMESLVTNHYKLGVDLARIYSCCQRTYLKLNL